MAIKSGIFKRGSATASGGSTPHAPGSGSINLRANAQAAPKVFDPSDYWVRIEAADIIITKRGNTLVAITLREEGSEQLIDIPPMWVAGPNERKGNLAHINARTVAQINAVCGAEDPYHIKADMLASWAGKRIGVELRVERGLGGMPRNAIEDVCDENGNRPVLDSGAGNDDADRDGLA